MVYCQCASLSADGVAIRFNQLVKVGRGNSPFPGAEEEGQVESAPRWHMLDIVNHRRLPESPVTAKKKHPDRLAELHSKLLTDFAVPLAPQGYLLLCSKDETDHNALVCGRCQWVKVNLQACGRCGHCGEILLEILPSSNCFPKE